MLERKFVPTKAGLGLGLVDNTSDAGKPVSTATQTALDGKAAKVAGQFFTNKAGAYLFPVNNIGTSATLGNGTLRVQPFYLGTAVTVTAIGVDFSAAGDAASLFRMAIYADDGTFYPGALALDGGSISTGSGNAGTVATGGTPGVYMNTLGAPLALSVGWYWVGGAVQGVTTTQPTMRTSTFIGNFIGASTAIPSAGGGSAGYNHASVTGTPPSSFTAFGNIAGSAPRIILRIQ